LLIIEFLSHLFMSAKFGLEEATAIDSTQA